MKTHTQEGRPSGHVVVVALIVAAEVLSHCQHFIHGSRTFFIYVWQLLREIYIDFCLLTQVK